MKNKLKKTLELLLSVNKRLHKYIILLNLMIIILIYLLVYFTGGIKYVYSHTMYIPIIISSILLGWKWGVVFAIFAAILMGPFMSVDVATGEAQQLENWLYRLLIFSLVGFLSGLGSSVLRENFEVMKENLNKNPLTNLPNINSLVNADINIKERTVISIHIINYDKIINLLGIDIYSKLINTIFSELKVSLPLDSTIIQADSYKMWLTLPTTNLENDVTNILLHLNRFLVIQNIPLYIEYAMGVNKYNKNMNYFNSKTYQVADELARQAASRNIPFLIYNEDLNLQKYDIDLLTSFIQAIELEQLFMTYQPKINLKTNQVIGFEALVRWHHPVRGLLMPDSFIPLIEDTQLIDDLTYYVIKSVIRKLKEFKAENINQHISINISIKNLNNSNFIERIVKTIGDNLDISRKIEFEITESVLIDDFCKQQLNILYDAGFVISIDDFGKGYSSLSYLSDIKFHRLKIDKHFILDIEDNDSLRYIVKAIIDLCHNLGYQVIAEGIENWESHRILKSLECNFGQGYYYSKPINENKVIDWLKNYQTKL